MNKKPQTKQFFWKDKTGRGFTRNDISLKELRSIRDEENWDGETLATWAKECEEGDEWENASDKYICTKS